MKKLAKPFAVVTSKIPGETEQQYSAFLLYSEILSINKLMEEWRNPVGEVSVILKGKLGKIPSERTLERWSVQYAWVRRADLKLTEDLEVLKKKTSQIRQRRFYYITDLLWDKIKKLRKQIDHGEKATVQEVKTLWEIVRIEEGETTSRQEIVRGIDESQQKPPTPEEDELGRAIDKVIMEFYDKQRKEKYQNK